MEAEGGRNGRAVQEAALEILDMVREGGRKGPASFEAADRHLNDFF